MASKGLNPRQTRFVAEYLKDLNATQAAIRSGYSAKTAEQIGSRLLRNVGVAAAVAKGQSRVAERLELSAEIVLRNLEKARAEAMAAGQFSAAIRAAELQGKHIGMFVERRETTITDKRMVVEAPPTAESVGEWERQYGRPN